MSKPSNLYDGYAEPQLPRLNLIMHRPHNRYTIRDFQTSGIHEKYAQCRADAQARGPEIEGTRGRGGGAEANAAHVEEKHT